MTASYNIAPRAIQRALNMHGANLTVDGDIGPKTRSAIYAAVQRETGAAAHWPTDRLLIAFEQIMLRDGGLDPGQIDGVMGPKTRGALAEWAGRQVAGGGGGGGNRVEFVTIGTGGGRGGGQSYRDWASIIRAVCPHGRAEIVAGAAAAMPRMIEIASLTTALRQAHFLAQIAHESAGMLTTVEYASGAAYEGRKDLGNTQRGDGVRFKGRGLIQLTGRANYMAYGFELGLDLVGKPELAAQFPAAALTAALYWRKRGINAPADRDDIEAVTRKINGGTNGLADRRAYLAVAKRALAA
jgi:putative chitinase